MRVVGDYPVLFAVNDAEVRVVLDARLARPHHLELAGGVCKVEHAVLGGQRRRRNDHEVAFRAVRAHADAELLVGFLVHQHVLGSRCAQLVAPDLVGAPGVVAADVEQVVLPRPRGAVEHALDFVVEQLAGVQVFEPHGEALVAFGVEGVREQAARGGHGRCPEREELVPGGELVDVEKHLFPRHVLGDLRRGPRVIGGRDAARDAVVLALDGAAVVPPVALALRHGHVGLFDAGFDLAVDVVHQPGPDGGFLFRIGVFGLEVRENFGVVLVAQPLVVVHELAAVEFADNRALVSYGWDHACSPGHSEKRRPESRSYASM